MIIEHLDSLKSWLIQTLTPICDADPDTLAKYVIALVKKEKPQDELRDSCFRDLDVFLQDKTKAFVSRLFDALHSKSYLSDHEAKNRENSQKEHVLNASHDPKENARTRQRPTDDNYRPAHVSDQRIPSEAPARLDSSASRQRGFPRDRLIEGDRGARKGDSGFHRFSEARKGAAPHQPRSPRVEQNLLAPYPSDFVSSGSEHNRLGAFDPGPINDLRNYRHRTSSLHRRVENRGHFSPRNSGNDGRYLEDRPRRYPSMEKMIGFGASGRYSSPLRSPQSDRADDMHISQQPWRQHQRNLERPDAHERFCQPMRQLRSPFSHSRSRTRSRTASRTPSRSADQAPITRSSRSRSRSLPRSRSASLTRKSSRSRSPILENSEKKVNLDGEPIDSRSSTPLEEEDYKVSESLLKIKYDARPSTRPRCRDYDEKGFCIRGDLCEFDHGNDPVVVDGMKIPFPPGRLSDSVAQLPPPLPPQGPPMMAPMPHMSKPVMQIPFSDSLIPPSLQFPSSDGGAAYLPPPPHLMPSAPHMRGIDIHLYPPPQGPPHLRPFLLMPPPFVGGRPMTLRPDPARSVGDLYQPMMMPACSVEPYLPEPYSPKSPTYQPLSKSDRDKWEASVDVDLGFASPRLGPGQISANRLTNLVRVPTDEVQTASEEKSETGIASKHAGMKRSADVLDVLSDSASSTAKSSSQPPPMKKTAFEHPGVRHGSANNTTLELRKIPREQNTIANINNHFSKFGIIVNLQVGWDGDSQAALVSFASNAQAQLAYRSQEPFLNNRFIKIFWHSEEKPAQSQALVPTAEAPRQRIIIPERHKLQLNNKLKNATQAAENAKLLAQQLAAKNASASGNVSTLQTDASRKLEASQTLPAVANEGEQLAVTVATTKTTTKSMGETSNSGSKILQGQTSKETHRDVLLKQLELRNKLQEVLRKQIEQQKILFEKLEKDKSTLSAEEKSDIIETIKKLAKTIEDLKASLNSMTKPNLASKSVPVSKSSAPASSSPAVVPAARGSLRKVNVVRNLSNSGKASGATSPRTSAKAPVFHNSRQAQKAILDTELDLMNRQKEGMDASELLKRVTALKEEAASLGLLGPSPGAGSKPAISHGRGRGEVASRGRGAGQGVRRWSEAVHTVDRRPKQLLVTGFLAEEKDDLIAHLQEFGELENSICDMSLPSLSVNFKSRLHAEKAASEGCNFNGKKLKMVWQKPSSVLTERNSTENAEPSLEKMKVKLLKDTAADAGKTKGIVASSLIDISAESDVGQEHKSKVVEKSKADGVVEKAGRLDSITGEDDEFDDETLLSIIDEEDDDDNNEGGRPWRR